MIDLLGVYSRGLDFETMRGLRTRFSNWYKGRLLEKDTYLEEDDESELSLNRGSKSKGDENTSENRSLQTNTITKLPRISEAVIFSC